MRNSAAKRPVVCSDHADPHAENEPRSHVHLAPIQGTLLPGVAGLSAQGGARFGAAPVSNADCAPRPTGQRRQGAESRVLRDGNQGPASRMLPTRSLPSTRSEVGTRPRTTNVSSAYGRHWTGSHSRTRSRALDELLSREQLDDRSAAGLRFARDILTDGASTIYSAANPFYELLSNVEPGGVDHPAPPQQGTQLGPNRSRKLMPNSHHTVEVDQSPGRSPVRRPSELPSASSSTPSSPSSAHAQAPKSRRCSELDPTPSQPQVHLPTVAARRTQGATPRLGSPLVGLAWPWGPMLWKCVLPPPVGAPSFTGSAELRTSVHQGYVGELSDVPMTASVGEVPFCCAAVPCCGMVLDEGGRSCRLQPDRSRFRQPRGWF